MIRNGWFYVLPLVVLVYYLMEGYAADYTAALTVIAVVAVSWWPQARRRITLRSFVDGCVDTCMILAPLVAAVAAAGIVVAVLTFTGVTGKAATVIFAITGKQLFLVLVAAMIISVLLGMGMPVVATYALSAVVVAPVMIELGVPILQAHFFLVYYAVLSFITPPIAISCYAAATIADESPMAVGWESMRIGLILFILPFAFVYDPGLLMIGEWHMILLSTVMAAIGVIYFGAAQVGWWRGYLPAWRRIVLIGCGARHPDPDVEDRQPDRHRARRRGDGRPTADQEPVRPQGGATRRRVGRLTSHDHPGNTNLRREETCAEP